MKPGPCAYPQIPTAEWVFPDLDLLQALAEEPAPRQARVLAFRSPEPEAAEAREAREAESR
jgi:hypothetical protein